MPVPRTAAAVARVLALFALAAAAAAAAEAPRRAEPRIMLDVQATEPLDDKSYGTAGPYEKVTGTLHGEVDPDDPANAIIVDLALAPKNARGLVEYAADFLLIKPRDMTRANGVLRYDAPNRGNLLTMPPDPTLLERGYVILHAAWQGDVPKSGPNRLTLTVPVAKNPDGSAITGLYRTELVTSAPVSEIALPGGTFNATMLPYAPARLDDTGPDHALTRRRNETDPRLVVPRTDWAFATTSSSHPFPGTPDPGKVSLKGGFDPRLLYELTYVARDPKVTGLGLAALRDYLSFFRTAARDSRGTPNPVAGHVRHLIGVGVSQSGNLLRTFLHLGFNQSREGGRVFDAIFSQVSPRLTSVNVRFGAPGGGSGLRTDHTWFGTGPRAFAADYENPLTGRTGGILKRSALTGTVPKIFLGLSSTEYWVLQGSPVLHDPLGLRDLDQPKEVRIYHFASTQHGGQAGVRWDPARSLYPAGVMNQHSDTFRALFLALEDWVVRGTEPPPSRTPRVADGTLVRPDQVVFPSMKGVTFPVDGQPRRVPDFVFRGWYDDWSVFDFGPRFVAQDESGIPDFLPPRNLGRAYTMLVPQVDADGLEVAGVRSVDIQAPVGTSLGFNYPADPEVRDFVGLSGAFIPFHRTKADRLAAGDGRLSLEERYATQSGYLEAMTRAARALVKERLLLPRDAERLVAGAGRNPILP